MVSCCVAAIAHQYATCCEEVLRRPGRTTEFTPSRSLKVKSARIYTSADPHHTHMQTVFAHHQRSRGILHRPGRLKSSQLEFTPAPTQTIRTCKRCSPIINGAELNWL